MSFFKSDTVDAKSLHALLTHELKDLYDAEHQILEALPMMIEQATNPELQKALKEHLAETKMHVKRLEDAFAMMNEKAERITCDGMKGLMKESEHVLKGTMDVAVKDDGIIGAAQRIEHYEIASYGTAREHAKNLGFDKMAELLDATLKEEGNADHTLTAIAKTMHKELAKAA